MLGTYMYIILIFIYKIDKLDFKMPARLSHPKAI